MSLKSLWKGMLFLFLAIMLALSPEKSIAAAKSGISLCLEVIIPSLFPFAVVASAIVKSGIGAQIGRLFSPLMRPIFGIDGCGAIPLILGFLGGYPMGAQLAAELYLEGSLSKREAEHLLAFCNNSGPLFILGTVGVGLFKSPSLGKILLISHILAALCAGLIFRFFSQNQTQPTKKIIKAKASSLSFSQIASESVTSSVFSILAVCGYIIFFSVMVRLFEEYGILSLLSSIFLGLGSQRQNVLIRGLFEVSTGVFAASSLPLSSALPLASVLISWGGLSVHFQAFGILLKAGLSKKTYILGKLLCAILSGVITSFILYIFPIDAPAWKSAQSPIIISSALGFKVLIFFFFLCALWAILKKKSSVLSN